MKAVTSGQGNRGGLTKSRRRILPPLVRVVTTSHVQQHTLSLGANLVEQAMSRNGRGLFACPGLGFSEGFEGLFGQAGTGLGSAQFQQRAKRIRLAPCLGPALGQEQTRRDEEGKRIAVGHRQAAVGVSEVAGRQAMQQGQIAVGLAVALADRVNDRRKRIGDASLRRGKEHQIAEE